MDERPGVRVGMNVFDADGKRLGNVTRCDPGGFEVVRGFWSPFEYVVGYDEVTDVRDEEVRVARSARALFDLADGRLPSIWRRRLPGGA
jgi:hypothetical protein